MRPSRLPSLACLPLLAALTACGGEDTAISPEAVARYGATPRTQGVPAGAPTTSSTPAPSAPVAAPPAAPAVSPGDEPGGARPDVAASPAPGGGAAKPKKGAKYEVITVEKGGSIAVSVKLTKAPPSVPVKLNKDQKGCGHETMESGRAVFNAETLALANAVVWLVDIAKGKDFEGEIAEANRTVVLDQKGCAYVPHVMLVRPGAKVSIKNSDPVQHNVKGFFNNKASMTFNVMSSSDSALPPSDDTTLGKSGLYILNCDIHHWMTGYIRTIPHPYFAVTTAEGTCGFTNVPPGEYRIGCWHEGMLLEMETKGVEITGYKYSDDFSLPEQTVNVPPEGNVQVAFTTDPR